MHLYLQNRKQPFLLAHIQINAIAHRSYIEGDGRLWTSNAVPVTCLFQNKVMFLLKIMLIYDDPLTIKRPPWVAA